MSTRILLPTGLLALALLALFWFRTSNETASQPAHLPRQTMSPEGSASEPAADPLVAPALDAGGESGALEARQVASAPPGAAERRAWPEDETRWLEVLVLAPEGTPRDETVWVAAFEERVDPPAAYCGEGPFAALHAGVEPTQVDDLLAAAPVAADGRARLGLPPDAEEIWLLAGGAYLHSLEPLSVALDTNQGPVELRPVLGAWISGRLTPPPGEPDGDLEGVEVRLAWSINASLQLGTAAAVDLDRETVTDAAGRFTFRAVPVGKPQTLSTDSPVFAAVASEDLLATPGEHVEFELPLLRGGSVSGRVVDEAGTPIPGAELRALGREFLGNPTAELREGRSGADGRFLLEAVTPGRVWLRVRAEGFQDLLQSPVELADGQSLDTGDLVMGRGLALAGTVTFPDGAAAAGASVEVRPDLSPNVTGGLVDPQAYIGAGEVDTGGTQGTFRITGLGPGPWVVAARLRVPDGDDTGRETGLWIATQSVVTAPAEDLALVLAAPVHVSGRVVDAAGEPVRAFAIRAERAGTQWYMPPSEERREEFETEDGRFRLVDLRAGDWTFTAEAEGYARSAEVKLALPSEEEVELILHRPVRLAGRVQDPDGQPVAGAEVGKELQGAEVIEAMQGRGDWPKTQSDADGNFVLSDLAPGAGSILAKKDGFAPSEAVPYELAEGEARDDLVLTLRHGGSISGEVYDADGQPASGCLVILQMPTLQERRFLNAESDGTFVERGLTPGTWQVQAFPGIESLQAESGETLDQGALLSALKMTTVELADGVEEHVVLGELPANPVRVHGRVTLDGEPLAESIISFVPADDTGSGGGMESLKIETLDEDGAFDLQLDEPGGYLVTIQSSGTPGRQSSVEFRRSIPAVEEHRLDFEMPLGRVSGRVHGPDGRPLAGVRVTLNMEGGLVFGTVFGGQYEETTSDENGEYDIALLRPGRYAVAAGGALLGGLLGGSEGFGRVVTSVEVGEDEWVRDVDFQLVKGGKIRGTVRDGAGALVSGAALFVRDGEGRLLELFSVFQTNASGSFEIPALAPGTYTVTARTATLASSGKTTVEVRSGETSEVTVVTEPGTVLLVTLVDKSGADVPSRVSVLDPDGLEMNGMLGLREVMERYSGGLGSAVQRVGPLPPGTYRVRAFAEDGRSTERRVTLGRRPERKVRLRLK